MLDGYWNGNPAQPSRANIPRCPPGQLASAGNGAMQVLFANATGGVAICDGKNARQQAVVVYRRYVDGAGGMFLCEGRHAELGK